MSQSTSSSTSRNNSRGCRACCTTRRPPASTSTDRLAADRLLLINGVSRAKGGSVAYAKLGRNTFRRADRTAFDEIVWTANGHTAIQVADEHGKQLVLPDCAKVQWNPSRTPTGGWALYVEWTVPDLPDIPSHIRGATVRVRHNSTEAELACG